MPIEFPQALRSAALIFFTIFAGLVFDASARQAKAQIAFLGTCSATMSTVNFGSVDVLPGTAATASGSMTITCTGVTLIGAVYVCVGFTPALAMTGPSSSTLQYTLGPPPSPSTPIQMTPGTILGLGSDSVTITVPAALLANQQLARPGAYSQTVTATIKYSTSTCTVGLLNGQSSTTFLVTATVVNSCNVSASNLNFGTFGDLNTAINGQTSLSVQCSNGIPYTISLNGGLSNATNPAQRKMTLGAGAILYGLYRDSAHANPWGNAAGATASGTGTAQSQSVPVYGLVPAQTTPPVGTYSDTIVVSVAY
jgi:spore coat protein U-like protein